MGLREGFCDTVAYALGAAGGEDCACGLVLGWSGGGDGWVGGATECLGEVGHLSLESDRKWGEKGSQGNDSVCTYTWIVELLSLADHTSDYRAESAAGPKSV